MRAIVGAVIVVIAVGLFIVLRDSGDDETASTAPTTPAPATTSTANEGRDAKKQAIPTIVIKGGVPMGGVEELTYSEGERIRFKVSSDVSDEVHIHGYDVSQDVKAGGTAEIDFPASITGIFEVELEGRAEQIAEIRVNP